MNKFWLGVIAAIVAVCTAIVASNCKMRSAGSGLAMLACIASVRGAVLDGGETEVGPSGNS